jgi:hypothetical protein
MKKRVKEAFSGRMKRYDYSYKNNSEGQLSHKNNSEGQCTVMEIFFRREVMIVFYNLSDVCYER